MGDLDARRAAVAFWTFMGAVVVTVLATVTGHLAPAVLRNGGADAMGYVALGLLFVAHLLPIFTTAIQLDPPVIPAKAEIRG